jgi:hypothetical protein
VPFTVDQQSADANDDTFAEIAEGASIPVVVDMWPPTWTGTKSPRWYTAAADRGSR